MSSSNNSFSELTCQVVDTKIEIDGILQRITPIQFIPNMDIILEEIPMTQTSMLTGPSMGTLTIQSYVECFGLEANNGYIHNLKVDDLVIDGLTGTFYTGPTGSIATGPTGPSGWSTNTGSTGPTGLAASMNPINFVSSSQLSITNPSPTMIRTDATFEIGTPVDGFEKTIINGYTGSNLLSPITNNIALTLNGTINTMQKANNTIYIGGNFTGSNDGSIKYPYIAKWDEQNGLQQVSGPTGPNGPVYAMAYDDTSNLLYVGGSFTTWRGVSMSPPNIGVLNVSTQSFQSLGVDGWSGLTGSCLALACNTSGTVYTGWEVSNQNQNLLFYNNNVWTGFTGAIASSFPKKIIPDNLRNKIYVGYNPSSTPIQEYSSIYSIDPADGTYVSVDSNGLRLTMALDEDSDVLYIGYRRNTTVSSTTSTISVGSLPFSGKSYMGTYTYGSTGTSAFHEVATPVSYLTYDNNLLYMCMNTMNSTLPSIINQKPYQGILSYDGNAFQNIADFDIYDNGLLTAFNTSKFLISPYPSIENRFFFQQPFLQTPPRTSLTNPSFIDNCGLLNTDASLSITAPIHYFKGGTGSFYKLYTIGDQVTMKWSSITNSWWI